MTGISFCTYGKNAMRYVRESIPHLLSHIGPADEIVYVDYSCDEHSGDYILDNYDSVKVVYVKDCPNWHMNHARNVSGKSATKDILCFMDIDNLINPDVIPVIREKVDPNNFVIIQHGKTGISGFCAIHKNKFYEISGYEETYVGYGYDDTSFYESLKASGCNKHELLNYYPKILPGRFEWTSTRDWNGDNREIGKVLHKRHKYQSNVRRNWGRI